MTTTTAVKSREYETIYVLRPDVDPDTADKVAARIVDVVGRENGKLVRVETWGRRKLAYTVAKNSRGVYYYLKYLGGGTTVSEVERNLRMLDNVLKFQTVLLRDQVIVETVTIDPEEIKFTRIEAATEDDLREDSPEKLLGLLDIPDAPQRQQSELPPEELDEPEAEAKEEV